MNITMTGKNIQLNESLKEAAQNRLNKLEKYFTDDASAQVTLSVGKGRRKAEITVFMGKQVIRSEETDTDMYIAIDAAADSIENQIKKHRKKLVTMHGSKIAGKYMNAAFLEQPAPEEEEIQIQRSKKVEVTVMTPEEACAQMDLLGHDFYLFSNPDSGEVNVVYKRRNGGYGWIEPKE